MSTTLQVGGVYLAADGAPDGAALQVGGVYLLVDGKIPIGRTPYTGKSAGVTATFRGTALPPWREIRISEVGKPLPPVIDKTHAASSEYTLEADPLDSPGAPETTVVLSGNMSRQDLRDAGLLAWPPDLAGELIIQKGAGIDHDVFTLLAEYKSLIVRHPHAGVVGYTLTFAAQALGAWSASEA